jgi:hypothetical protein
LDARPRVRPLQLDPLAGCSYEHLQVHRGAFDHGIDVRGQATDAVSDDREAA